jgi:hypothetical protein
LHLQSRGLRLEQSGELEVPAVAYSIAPGRPRRTAARDRVSPAFVIWIIGLATAIVAALSDDQQVCAGGLECRRHLRDVFRSNLLEPAELARASPIKTSRSSEMQLRCRIEPEKTLARKSPPNHVASAAFSFCRPPNIANFASHVGRSQNSAPRPNPVLPAMPNRHGAHNHHQADPRRPGINCL